MSQLLTFEEGGLKSKLASLSGKELFFAVSHFRHELRNPMTYILGNISLHLEEDGVSFESKKFFNAMYDNVRTIHENLNEITPENCILETMQDIFVRSYGMIGLIQRTQLPEETTKKQLKDINRIKQEVNELGYLLGEALGIDKPGKFFFERQLSLLSRLNGPYLKDRKIILTTQQDRPLVTNVNYRTELSNLVGNAIKHGFPNGHENVRRITVSVYTHHHPYLVRVRDTGTGIDADAVYQKAVNAGLISSDREMDQQEKLQLVFSQGISTGGEKGINGTSEGYGLAGFKKLIERKGGDVSVKSSPGETKFYFTIPEENVISPL
ncbi:sensor histidine kinase [Candidatus Woesearchaeota archaeon]|jgi:signal transduction histidine kinase|nr:sensor histidine kinase [Candidatus Woesearchaeota archaeon]MBT5740247.1 sensor histidine kinase [Candidatus Woesearchaeota archaeon]